MFYPDTLLVKSTLAEMCARAREDPAIQGKWAGSQACQGDWPKEETPHRSDGAATGRPRGCPSELPCACLYTSGTLFPLSRCFTASIFVGTLFCRAGGWAPCY